MSNFWKRAITGTLFVVVMVGGIWYNYWSLAGLFFVIAMLGLHEFYGLLKHANIQPQKWVGMVIGAIVFAAFTYERDMGIMFTLMVPLLAAIFFIELWRNKTNPFVNIAMTVLGILYIVLPFAMWVGYSSPYLTGFVETHKMKFLDALQNIFQPPYRPHVLLGFFFILWTNDTGAYVSGMAMGKHKLWERISPKKTWEGFVGGVILSVAVAFLISHYYKELSPIMWMVVGLLISVFGTLGDLVESVFKRSINVKESGGILPGHGGILDRFDGVFLSTPIVLALFKAVEVWGILFG